MLRFLSLILLGLVLGMNSSQAQSTEINFDLFREASRNDSPSLIASTQEPWSAIECREEAKQAINTIEELLLNPENRLPASKVVLKAMESIYLNGVLKVRVNSESHRTCILQHQILSALLGRI